MGIDNHHVRGHRRSRGVHMAKAMHEINPGVVYVPPVASHEEIAHSSTQSRNTRRDPLFLRSTTVLFRWRINQRVDKVCVSPHLPQWEVGGFPVA